MLIGLKSDKIIFTGGVAIGYAIKHFIETELNVEVIVPEYPQLNGAIGCIAYGIEQVEKNKWYYADGNYRKYYDFHLPFSVIKGRCANL